ncbi:hypothetical protein H257_14299 [Aphanomyces astaci]|uniref:Uncharacterized protein n=1 Tax=Aphanomyces astaci TaxID=112090 RepID=W4FU15_APHAT|nr:hypothetical protein H257_14299 [Aphanomyces astaci]ETV70138.1 hypothetical protein H257_14299 [Aphanomyces astaci]|eukprot:XP_009840369.1 hypothetical protein H257_14299 [Aphanomyces astaci]
MDDTPINFDTPIPEGQPENSSSGLLQCHHYSGQQTMHGEQSSSNKTMRAPQDGDWDIQIQNQPAQSPDLNVLDLGFFNSIQALQQALECQTMEELIGAVKEAFSKLSHLKLDKTFKTLQRVMQVIIEAKGDNRYKMPRSC